MQAISTANNSVIATIPIGFAPAGIVVTPDGKKLYVSFISGGGTAVDVVSTATNTVLSTITCSSPCSNSGGLGGVAITPDGSRVYAAAGNGVLVISTATDQQQDFITGLPGQPISLGVFIPMPMHVAVQPAPKTGTTCNGTYNGTFNGSITVSSGQNCQFISGGQITGNIAATGGNVGLNGASVGGNVNITGGAFSLTTATIGGNLEITNVPVGNANNSICGIQVTGNMKFDQNGVSVQIGSNSPMTCAGNTIGGNMEALANTASTLIFSNTVGKNLTAGNNTGPLDVVGNKVGATLTCQGNTNLVMGSGNTAKKKVGQCY